ncbi:MAG: hypothetical protein A2836_03100 [Candidatus Taylorbacteria bacterium RIFCSPHIGHO2_01_FULL_45_63]|uniref:Uncharacterized protein n=1 Tax=Candidatus Taylorbacteria bacterium RIFCSPHIGHO2_02_FULL_45_35 TaxID=1802311 RepID=A0A1G2MX94_9BACT|nr:MAG: hypothetical protein A2836_03100 [Candidatus Taylorbacteria bacterium RIFCSPHIGHO2_01_FULL_45_63]OHA27672.1 MAG: hypothetical protein A3D56_02150 [Candidatus Taylorbacteria bacterium RIFCSPHIGHO2_02_FULL_45_35]OHA32527.1 MAG: hypothetical protein A3A22_03265 [Candidatus Taylorbacteria bacterium RIFCSPLOWO2_01_FULL_45_34b]
MVQVQFDEGPQMMSSRGAFNKKSSGITVWLIRKQIIKSERQAQMLLIGIFIICAGLSVYFFAKAFSSPKISSVNPPGAPLHTSL